ncbi:MAG: TonB-dependent receptor [Bacteroidales bacterium]|nr:TonB-dependent receptor [Bacteroidales bacterium]
MKQLLFIFFLCFTNILFAQQKGVLQGKIIDEKGNTISFVSVSCEETKTSLICNDDGSYKLELPINQKVFVYFSKIGYFEHKAEILLTSEKKTYSPVLRLNALEIPKVKITYDKDAEENVTSISSEKATAITGLSMAGIEGGLKTFAGVNAKSELSSQYSVRGGSYDENLVYVNGVPAFKPSMARSDKQEGLSIINPYMVDNVDFSSGGFDICYGDKMSSVLNVTYKDVEEFHIQADASFMDANVTIQGTDKKQKFSILTGARYKNTSLVLSTLDETGEYKPIFYDFQSLLKYKINPKLTLSYWIYGANNTYSFLPDKRVTDFGSQVKSYKMTIYFEGEEKYTYRNLGNALSLNYRPTERTFLDLNALYYHASENETFDVLSQYRLSESFSNGETLIEDSTALLAVGSFLEHGRNKLKNDNITVMHDGKQLFGSYSLNWGFSVSSSYYNAQYNEWTFMDSANYAQPYCDTAINLKNAANSTITHNQTISAGYLGFSKRIYFDNSKESTLKINAGIRGTFDTYSSQLLWNPRMRFLFKPSKDKSNRISFSTGIYYQPAEFKELIDKFGQFHTNVKPQKSTHFVLGYSQTLTLWNRPFFWNTELYMKKLKNIIPYTIDNVSTVYYPNLCADGYITGIDTKINGEFVPGIESWINLSLMRAREHLTNTASSEIRRANDQLLNFSMFFQDYLPNSEKLKMNLTFMAGSNIPTATPTASYEEFDDFKISSYTRLDIGFLYVFIDEQKQIENKSTVKNLTLGLEIFNLFDNPNKISYFWIEDVSNNYYAVPNYLTSRRLNLKLTLKI